MSLITSEPKQLIGQLVALGTPIVLQNLVGACLNMVDTIMIGHLGEAVIGGATLANQIAFLFNLLLFGVGSGAMILTSQFWGQANILAIRRVLALCLWVMTGAALLFATVSITMSYQIMRLFSPDPAVVAVGSQFLQVLAVGFIFQAISTAYISVMRSVEKVRAPLVAGVVSLSINTLLNWCLIFGNAGLPTLGYVGAALSTAIARFFELSIILGVIYWRWAGRSEQVVAVGVAELFSVDKAFFNHFIKVSWPVVGNEVGWALGFVIPNVVFAHLSTQYVAAASIADTAIKLAIVIFFGTITANSVLVGKAIGAGLVDEAVKIGRFFGKAALVIGLGTGLLLLSVAWIVPGFFNVSPYAQQLATVAMILFAANLPLRVFGWHMVVGNFRAGGDVHFSLYLELGPMWLVALPACLIAGFVLGAPFWVVYLATLLDDVPKFFLSVWRFRSRKWLHDMTRYPASN